MGIETIADLKAAAPPRIRKKFSVVLQRTVLKLEPLTTVAGLEEVMSIYAQRCAQKLHEEGLRAFTMTVTAGTRP